MTTSADAALAEALRLLTWPDRIALARDVDMGGADLARIVGVSRATVSSHAKRHGGLPDKRAERSAERMRRLHADGRVHPHIALMTPEQRADYDTLRRNGYRKAEALAALGLVARRDALPPGSHKRAALDERIRAMTHDMLEGRA